METTAVIMMILILGVLWGGLAFSLWLAHKKEMVKQDEGR